MNPFDGLPDIFVGVMGENELMRFIHETGDSPEVPGIFTERWRSQEAGDFGAFDGSESAADVRSADLPSNPERAFLERNGMRYRIVSVRPDEQGMTKLILQRAGPASQP